MIFHMNNKKNKNKMNLYFAPRDSDRFDSSSEGQIPKMILQMYLIF